MKEIIEKLIAAIPAFVRQLIGLLSGPKTFLAKLDFEAPGTLTDALMFIAVCFGASFLMGIPWMQEKQNKELAFGIAAVQAALALLLTVAITVLAWKSVGGKFDWKQFIIATCYFSGISTLLWAVIELVGVGTANIVDPTRYRQLMSGNPSADPTAVARAPAFYILLGTVCVGLIVRYGWSFCVWAAYRAIAGVSRRRSGFAFIIFTLLLMPLELGIEGLMAGATITYHPSPPLPHDLVGEWTMQRESDAGGTHTQRRVLYRFYVDGFYIVDITRSVTDKCVKTVADSVVGFAGVDGHTLTLIKKTHTRETKDSCTRENSKINIEPDTDVYQFRIDQQPSGWQLCLSNRFGETCYIPFATNAFNDLTDHLLGNHLDSEPFGTGRGVSAARRTPASNRLFVCLDQAGIPEKLQGDSLPAPDQGSAERA